MSAYFDGVTYDPSLDLSRLSSQLERVWHVIRDGNWYTLDELARKIGGNSTTQSVSARLRDLRKERFGSYNIERRRVEGGLWEYRMVLEDRGHQLELELQEKQ